MTDPLAKAGAIAPPVIGAGCAQRYDPEHLTPELGTDFPGAETLWARCAPASEKPAAAIPGGVMTGDQSSEPSVEAT